MSLAHELKAQDPNCKVVYIGHRGDSHDQLQIFDKFYSINAGKFRRYHGESVLAHLTDIKTILLNIRDFLRVVISLFSSYSLLKKIKPDVVFSKGSFVAVPVGIAAKLQGVPIITHDSDAVPGLANRIIGRWAKLHATGMPAEFYDYPKEKTVFTGIPIAKDIKPVDKTAQQKYKKELGLPEDSLVLLISGGGNGAVAVNNLVISGAGELLEQNPKLHILHIAGVSNEQDVTREYHAVLDVKLKARVNVLGFTKEFYKYTGAADLIISRAGATSIAEFALQGKAVIIIPSPFLAGGHQLKNAEELGKTGAGVVLNNDATSDELLVLVNELLRDAARRAELAKNISAFAKPNATQEIARLILAASLGEVAG